MLLDVENLRVSFKTDAGEVRAVDGISFRLEAGETLGIVGESGSGKSVTNLARLDLIPKPPGVVTADRVQFQDRDLLKLSRREMQQIRGNRIAMIFQDPMTSLNPFLTIAQQLTEVTMLHRRWKYKPALTHAIEMLERVGIPAAGRRVHEYPYQFSGGMRQRVMIAMALSCQPDLLIADEPTTALDVTIQAQILELIQQLQREEGTAVILITHDLGVVANVCQRVNVMYAGRFVEEASVDALFAQPRHPYTLGLLNSLPRLDEARGAKLHPIAGQPPDLTRVPDGCVFHPRCPFRIDRCLTEPPALTERIGDRRYACFVDVEHQPQASLSDS